MKFNNKLIALSLGALSLGFVSCENQDVEFPDYDGGVSVYFAYQTPVRTLVLGSDEADTSYDKAHKCKISATMGGAYKGRNITIDVAVDESLLNNVVKADGTELKAMPSNYYTLSGNQMKFGGKMTGSIDVQLTDAFFADPLSAQETYVIPVIMKSQTGADHIISGKYDTELLETAPAKTDADSWEVKPMDYTLYCVTYKSKYDGWYSRCGKYSLNGAEEVQIPADSTAKYKDHFDPVTDGADCKTVTMGLNQVRYSVDHKIGNKELKADLVLTFDASGNCTVASETEGVTATGNGKFTDLGAKKAWNNKDRDLIELNYTLDNGADNVTCKESLVWKASGVRPANEFSIKYVAE